MTIVHFSGDRKSFYPCNQTSTQNLTKHIFISVKEEMKRLIAKHPKGIDGFEEHPHASS